MTEIDEIVRSIEQDRVVFVVGSGMSRLVGLPTGRELASQLNASFQLGLAPPECDDLQKVSMLIESQGGRGRLVDAVIAALNTPEAQASQAHRTLVKIARRIVTTNYDTVIENAARKSVPVKELKVIRRAADCSSLTPPFLIKSHGCLTDKETIVATSVDYLKRVEERGLLDTVLKFLYYTNDLVLLGYSATDMDFLLALYRTRKELADFAGKVYAVLDRPTVYVTALLERLNFTVICEDVQTFMCKLADCWEHRVDIRVTPTSIDVGGFHIEFGLLVGDADRSVFGPSEIQAQWLKKDFVPNEPVRTLLSEDWSQVIKNTPVEGKELRFDDLSRLSGYKTTGRGKVLLKLQRTNYRDFLLTNLLLTIPVVPTSQGQPRRSIWELGHADMEQCLPYLANPLNVIAMIVSADGFTFIPKRSPRVWERPETWQASVGGSCRFREHPTDALIRRTKIEWGLDICPEEICFLGLGRNQRTGEPDLIAMVQTKAGFSHIVETFSRQSQRLDFTCFECVKLEEGNLEAIATGLRSKEWSQPSDQAAVLLVVIRKLGKDRVLQAFRAIGA